MRSTGMHTQWFDSAGGLPLEGQPVEFVLDGREIAMDGTYGEGVFHSHWSGYPIKRVRAWRPADSDCCGTASAYAANG